MRGLAGVPARTPGSWSDDHWNPQRRGQGKAPGGRCADGPYSRDGPVALPWTAAGIVHDAHARRPRYKSAVATNTLAESHPTASGAARQQEVLEDRRERP